MKLLIVTIVTLLMCACAPNNNLNLAKGDFLCAKHGGLYVLYIMAGAVCTDGTEFSVNEINNTVITDPEYFPSNKEKIMTNEEKLELVNAKIRIVELEIDLLEFRKCVLNVIENSTSLHAAQLEILKRCTK